MHSQADEQHEPPDPALERLLDAALGPDAIPGGVPADLVARITAATEERLPRRGGVLARIDCRPVRALAASVVLAASIGIVLAVGAVLGDVQNLRAIDRELTALQQWAAPFEEIDEEIQLVALQLDQLQDGANWDGALALLDEQITAFEVQFDDPMPAPF